MKLPKSLIKRNKPKCLLCLSKIKNNDECETFFFNYPEGKKDDFHKNSPKDNEMGCSISMSARMVHKSCFDELKLWCFEKFVEEYIPSLKVKRVK